MANTCASMEPVVTNSTDKLVRLDGEIISLMENVKDIGLALHGINADGLPQNITSPMDGQKRNSAPTISELLESYCARVNEASHAIRDLRYRIIEEYPDISILKN